MSIIEDETDVEYKIKLYILTSNIKSNKGFWRQKLTHDRVPTASCLLAVSRTRQPVVKSAVILPFQPKRIYGKH